MNALWCFGMHERDADASEEPQGHKTLFRILKAVVFKGKRRSRKNLLGIHEIQAVRGQVGAPLWLVPGKSHLKNIYAYRIYVKRARG